MSQFGTFISATPVVLTLTGDIGGAITPVAHDIVLAGGTNINTAGTIGTITINLDDEITLTKVNATTFTTNVAALALQLQGTVLGATGTDANINISITPKGAGRSIITNPTVSGMTAGTLRSDASGDITSLADGTDGMLLIGKTADVPIWANITSTGSSVAVTNGANTVNLETLGVSQDNIFYVGKHGNDVNDGLTINKAFLTFSAAQVAASSGDVVWCADDGTYTENLTGVSGISIYAPNATLAGAHTVTTDNHWTFRQMDVATATTGITMATAAQRAFVTLSSMVVAGTGIGVICTDGNLLLSIDFIEIDDGYFIGSTTADEVQVQFGELHITGTGTAVAGVTGCSIYLNGGSIRNSGVGDGTVFETTGAGAPLISANVSMVYTEKLSDITAGSVVNLNVGSLTGALVEAAAGKVIIGGATKIEGVPIGVITPSTGTFTTANATTFDTNVAAAGVTLAGTSLVADGTDADIDINITPKGLGFVNLGNTTALGVIADSFETSDTDAGLNLSGTSLVAQGDDVSINVTITAKGVGQVIINDLNISELGTGTLRSDASGDISSLADGTNGNLLIGSTGAEPAWGDLASADGSVSYTLGAGTLDLSAGGLDRTNILYVGKHGNDASNGKTPAKAKLTIQAAVTIAVAGDTIIVFPGTYTETITHVASNVTLIAEGKPINCIITQFDANVIDFAGYSGIQYKYFGISCTDATTAIWTITGTTGVCSFKECQLSMTTAANITAAAQPGIGRVTGAGTLTVIFGKAGYYHTGDGGATAQKAAFAVGDGGMVALGLIEDLIITNSGTALVTGVGIDTASTGNFDIHDCIVEITDPGATLVVGLAYLGGTGTDSEFYRNTIHVTAGAANTGYGFFSADTASTSRFFFNHIHVEDTGGTSHSYLVGATATVTAIFDDVIAADGATVVATGIFYEVKSSIAGDLICSGPTAAGTRTLTVANTDNTATASSSAVNVSVGGATSTGDPYTNYLVTGAGTYSVGIDNSDSDNFKITSGATPSAGTDLLTMTSAGVITLNNDLDVSEGGTGVSTMLIHGLLVGADAADVVSLAVGGANTALLGAAGADPAWGSVPNATLTNSSVTLSDGNNITVTGSPLSLGGTASFNLTGTTDHGLQLGNATGSLTSLGVGTTNQVLLGATGSDPTWGAVDLTTDITGILPIANGGTNASSMATTYGVNYFDGTRLVTTAVGTSGTILTGVTGGAPTWTTTSYPSTVATGDIIAATNTNVITTIAGTTAADGYVLTGNGSGVLPSWQAVSAAFTWTEVTGATVSLAGNAGYVMNRGTAITATLPAACEFGKTIRISGKGDGLTVIAQNASQMIHFSSSTTTTGVGGSLTATNKRDNIELLCVVADLEFEVCSSIGNWTLV